MAAITSGQQHMLIKFTETGILHNYRNKSSLASSDKCVCVCVCVCVVPLCPVLFSILFCLEISDDCQAMQGEKYSPISPEHVGNSAT